MSGEGARGVIIFLAYFTFQAISRGFFSKNRRTLFGALKYQQTLFNAQILLYKDFCDFLRFTRLSSIANAFLPFAMDLREANLRPTYLATILTKIQLREVFFNTFAVSPRTSSLSSKREKKKSAFLKKTPPREDRVCVPFNRKKQREGFFFFSPLKNSRWRLPSLLCQLHGRSASNFSTSREIHCV